MLRTHEGYGFEKMVRGLTEEASRKGVGDFLLTDLVRGYWNKADGSDIEIDLVALNDEDRVVRFGSCKRSAAAHDASQAPRPPHPRGRDRGHLERHPGAEPTTSRRPRLKFRERPAPYPAGPAQAAGPRRC
ncbi:MAG: hypothetical protein H6907_04785 [Hyphomicrobiales bacterium]|nr:hypothetical protein [Hyphomicrobiales bacterium]